MKKIFFIITFFLISFLTINEVNAQTPPCTGFANSEVMQFELGDCIYNVKLCWTCVVTGQDMKIAIHGIWPEDPDCQNSMNISQVWNAALDKIRDPNMLLLLCTDLIPPCGNGYYYYDIIDYNCKYLFNDNGTIYMMPCYFDTYCLEEREVCWNEDKGEFWDFVISKTQVGGTPACSGTSIPNDPPSGQSSVCWLQNQCQ